MSIFDSRNHFASIDAFYALHLTEFHMSMHSHARCEIMYIIKGSCVVKTPSDEFMLSAHEFIFLDENLPHQLEIGKEEPCSILNLEFSCNSQTSNLDLLQLSSESPAFSSFLRNETNFHIGTDSENLGYALKDLISRLQKKTETDSYLIKLLFFRMLLELSLCCQKKASVGSVVYLKKACKYIQDHLTEELRIPEIASYAGVNKSYLHSLFSKYINCTIVDYINRCRLTHAAFLLANSSMPVTEIAFQAGYNSRQHFSATFEKYYGITPRAYRQLNQKLLNTSTGQAQLKLHSNGIITETVFPIQISHD